MKARHIRKIRKRVDKFDTYEIHESIGMFGTPYHDTTEAIVKADSVTMAMRRFFRYYERRYKRYHDDRTTCPSETTREWGRFEVVNTRTGFHHYVR